ncbi:MAG TPA: hypothetical protein VM261_26390 [Kofleriaceae bacterium]|nr:hypothetical protein [Kofleriaceae bacterium]
MKRFALLLLLVCARTAIADDAAPSQFVGASVTGFAGFLRHNVGSYVVFYEHGVGDHHAVRAGGDFVHIHHAADHVQSHQWTYGGSLGYRYHLRSGGGPFGGAEVGYRFGHGHFGDRDSPDHVMLESHQLRVMPELGYRVIHPRLPVAFTMRVAAGYGPYEVTTTRDDAIGAAAVLQSEDNLGATGIAFDVELSFAYAF